MKVKHRKTMELKKHRSDSIIRRLKKIIQETEILFLLPIPPVIAMTLSIAGALIGQKLYPNGIPPLYTAILILLMSLIVSLTGLITIYRREMPGPFGYKIRGIYPVITGILSIIFFLGLGILVLITAILDV
jgi:hypothetical protein